MPFLDRIGLSYLIGELKKMFAKVRHAHTKSDITDFPTSLPASGGSADSATKATQDSKGQTISSTYIKDISPNGTNITFTRGDDTTGNFFTQDTTYENATETADGLMSAEDKKAFGDLIFVPGGGSMEVSSQIGEGPFVIKIIEDEESSVAADQVSYRNTTSGVNTTNLQDTVDKLFSEKASKVANATAGHVATLDVDGNPVDSGKTMEEITPQDALTVPGGGTMTLDPAFGSGPCVIEVTPEEAGGDWQAAQVKYNNVATGMAATDVQAAITELFTDVSEGKGLIAAAVTGKGVQTAADESFTNMAGKIGQIETGGKVTQPENVSFTLNFDLSKMSWKFTYFYLLEDGTISSTAVTGNPSSQAINVLRNSYIEIRINTLSAAGEFFLQGDGTLFSTGMVSEGSVYLLHIPDAGEATILFTG